MGFAITACLEPGAFTMQLAAVTLGMGIYGTLVWLLGRLHLAVKLRWPVAAAAAALLAFNVVMGERIFGAKNWISVGPISFQPSELVKLAFILAGGRHPGPALCQAEPDLHGAVFRLLRGMSGADE